MVDIIQVVQAQIQVLSARVAQKVEAILWVLPKSNTTPLHFTNKIKPVEECNLRNESVYHFLRLGRYKYIGNLRQLSSNEGHVLGKRLQHSLCHLHSKAYMQGQKPAWERRDWKGEAFRTGWAAHGVVYDKRYRLAQPGSRA